MRHWRREEMERMRAWRPRSDELRLEHLLFVGDYFTVVIPETWNLQKQLLGALPPPSDF